MVIEINKVTVYYCFIVTTREKRILYCYSISATCTSLPLKNLLFVQGLLYNHKCHLIFRFTWSPLLTLPEQTGQQQDKSGVKK